MLIRPLDASDARAFWALRLRGFEESPASFNTAPDEWRAYPFSDVERMLRGETGTPSDVVFGAFDPALCGHVGLRREARRKRAHKATLWGLYVAPEVRGRGIGLLLIEALLARARSTPGLTVIELTVMAANTQAVALYRGLEFQRFGYQPKAAKVGDIYLEEEHLMLDLERPAEV
jgi:ribosomal protein S18 acetylase RimI-like enzyme